MTTARPACVKPWQIRVEPDMRPGWVHVLDGPEALIASFRALPGVILSPGTQDRVLVPWNLVCAFPDAFEIEPSEGPLSTTDAATQLPVWEQLRGYQREAVEFARARPGTYLGLDIGVGKTLTAAITIASDSLAPVLVVGPLISRGTWCGDGSEPMKWLGIDVVPLTGRPKGKITAPDSPSGWYFTHYDVLRAWLPWILVELQPRALVVDEAHLAKSRSARRTRALRAIPRLKSVERRLALSGTPIENRLEEAWAQLDCVEPDAWGDHFSFMQRYGGAEFADGHWTYHGVSAEAREELLARLRSVYFHRSRSVLLDLPPITRQKVATTLEPRVSEAYAKAEHDIRAYLGDVGRALAAGAQGERLAQLTTLMLLLAKGKVAATTELVVQALHNGEKVVVFSWFKETLREIKRRVEAEVVAHRTENVGASPVCDVVTGDMPVATRASVARAFADSAEPAVFLATIAAAGVSMNELSAARVVVFNDLWWTPSKILQAEGRCWRSGQQRAVLAYYVCAQGTVDEYITKLLLEKSEVIETLGAGDDTRGFAEALHVSGPSEQALIDRLIADVLQGAS